MYSFVKSKGNVKQWEDRKPFKAALQAKKEGGTLQYHPSGGEKNLCKYMLPYQVRECKGGTVFNGNRRKFFAVIGGVVPT
jgi:hypothetical protein